MWNYERKEKNKSKEEWEEGETMKEKLEEKKVNEIWKNTATKREIDGGIRKKVKQRKNHRKNECEWKTTEVR